jgi:hypothetical protein
MQFDRKLILAASVFVLAMLSATFLVANAQESQERMVHANGKGTLKIGDEQFKISSAIVKLLPDHTAELTLVSDITIFLSAKWSNHPDSQQEFDLDVTGGATGGGVDAAGKLSLGDDGKSIKRLTIKGVSRTTKRAVEADFEGK